VFLYIDKVVGGVIKMPKGVQVEEKIKREALKPRGSAEAVEGLSCNMKLIVA
jgi:hypothetical protein